MNSDETKRADDVFAFAQETSTNYDFGSNEVEGDDIHYFLPDGILDSDEDDETVKEKAEASLQSEGEILRDMLSGKLPLIHEEGSSANKPDEGVSVVQPESVIGTMPSSTKASEILEGLTQTNTDASSIQDPMLHAPPSELLAERMSCERGGSATHEASVITTIQSSEPIIRNAEVNSSKGVTLLSPESVKTSDAETSIAVDAADEVESGIVPAKNEGSYPPTRHQQSKDASHAVTTTAYEQRTLPNDSLSSPAMDSLQRLAPLDPPGERLLPSDMSPSEPQNVEFLEIQRNSSHSTRSSNDPFECPSKFGRHAPSSTVSSVAKPRPVLAPKANPVLTDGSHRENPEIPKEQERGWKKATKRENITDKPLYSFSVLSRNIQRCTTTLSPFSRSLIKVYRYFEKTIKSATKYLMKTAKGVTRLSVFLFWGLFDAFLFSCKLTLRLDAAILPFLFLYLTPLFCDMLMACSVVIFPQVLPHTISILAFYGVCTVGEQQLSNTLSATSKTGSRRAGAELSRLLLQSMKQSLPFSFIIEGFDAPSSALMLLSSSSRLSIAYWMSLVLKGSVLSPVGWVGFAVQEFLLFIFPPGYLLDMIQAIFALSCLGLIDSVRK